MKTLKFIFLALSLFVAPMFSSAQEMDFAPNDEVVFWFSPLNFLPGDSDLTLYSPYNHWLTVVTSRAGDYSWITLPLDLPERLYVGGYSQKVKIKSVTICYELKNKNVYISHIRFTRLDLKKDQSFVIHDDPKDLKKKGPKCYTSTLKSTRYPDSSISLRLELNFLNTNTWVKIGPVKVVLSYL